MISDVGQDVFQVGTRVNFVELARSDQAIHRGGPLAPAVGANEQIIFASERDTAQGIFGKHVAYLGQTVLAVEREGCPVVQRVVDRLGERGFRRQRREFCPDLY